MSDTVTPGSRDRDKLHYQLERVTARVSQLIKDMLYLAV